MTTAPLTRMIPRTVPAAEVATPAIQFASGATQARFAPTARFTPLTGFHSEAGRVAAWDAVLEQLRVPRIEIKHQRTGGVEVRTHWYLGDDLRFFPLTAGSVARTVAGCVRQPHATAQAGLGVRWSDGRSKLAVRGFVAVRVNGAWAGPVLQLVQLAVRSRMTDRLLAALLDHGRVCQAADGLVDRARHPEEVAFHELALPLTIGEEESWGKGDTATVVPLGSAHPAEIDRAYVAAHWRSKVLHKAALAAWGDVQAWAAGYQAEG